RFFRRVFTPGSTRRLLILIGTLLGIASAGGTASLVIWGGGGHARLRASIVVLPFANLSADPGQDYFADAVTDDVTTDLSRLADTFVIARGTAFTYKGKGVDAKQIGRELDVRYILEGSVRKVGTAVQTNAQLIDADSGAHVWADRFHSDIADLLDLQNFITGRIATSLGIELVRAEGRRPLEDRRDVDAIDLRMRGLALIMQSFTPDNSIQARQLFERAAQMDPQAADAWSWLATVLASDYLNRWNN